MTAPLNNFPLLTSSATRPSAEELLASFEEMTNSMVTPKLISTSGNKEVLALERHSIALAFALPRGELYKALLVDMRDAGLRVPIVTYQGRILDGWDRYCACRELSLMPTFQEYLGSEPLAEFFRLNVLRRHLPMTQLAAIVFRNTDPELQAKHGGRRGQAETLPLATARSQAILAGCCEKTQQTVNKIGRASPEAVRLMAEEGLSIKAAEAIAFPKMVVAKKQPIAPKPPSANDSARQTEQMAALNNGLPEGSRMPPDLWNLYLKQQAEQTRKVNELCFIIGVLEARLLDFEPASATNQQIRDAVGKHAVMSDASPLATSGGVA